jgi:hypothetical protein
MRCQIPQQLPHLSSSWTKLTKSVIYLVQTQYQSNEFDPLQWKTHIEKFSSSPIPTPELHWKRWAGSGCMWNMRAYTDSILNYIQKKRIHLNPKPWEENKASFLELIGLCDSIMCILIAHIQKEFWTQNAHIFFSPSPIGQCLSQCHRYVHIAFNCVHSLWDFGWVLHLLLHFLELAFVGCGYENVQEHHTSV